MNRRTALLPIAFAPLCLAQTPPPLFTLAPVDDSSKDPDLVKFLARLRSIADAKDARSLEALMSPTFRVDFDTGKGPAAFHKHWAPQSHSSPVWEILTRILSLGGAFFSPKVYSAPYVFARFPIDLDLLSHVVAIWEDVPLLPKPDTTAEPLQRVSHAILPLARPLTPPVSLAAGSFLELKLPEQPPSFVATADVYSPAGYRIFLEKQAGRWRWISLACGTLAYPPDLKRLDAAGKTAKL